MEDSRPPIEDVKDEEDSPRKESSLFSQLLDRLRQPSEDEEGESEEQPDKLKPSRRLERFFGKLFRQTVTAPKSLEQPTGDVEPMPSAMLIEGQVSPQSSADEAFEGEADFSGPDLGDESNVSSNEASFDNSDRHLGAAPDTQEVDVPQVAPKELIQNNSQPDAPIPKNNAQEFSKVMREPALVYERNAATVETSENIAQPTITPEAASSNKNKVDRRGTAIVTALLGAEFWARRRADREIRRDLKKVRQEQKRASQRTTDIESSLAAQSKTLDKHPSLASVDIPVGFKRPDAFPHKLEKTTAVSLPHSPENEIINREVPKPSPTLTEKLVAGPPLFEQKIETKSPNSEADVVNLTQRQQEIDVRKKAENKMSTSSPEKVLQAVAEAAEKNVPLEKDYERRHEVKDASTQVTTGVASVGAILTGMGINSSTPLPKNSVSPRAKTVISEPKFDEPKLQSADMYQQAVRKGFWSAIVIIVFIIIIGLYRN